MQYIANSKKQFLSVGSKRGSKGFPHHIY